MFNHSSLTFVKYGQVVVSLLILENKNTIQNSHNSNY